MATTDDLYERTEQVRDPFGIDKLASPALAAALEMRERLVHEEEEARARGDFDTAEQRRGERTLLIEAMEKLVATRAEHARVVTRLASRVGPIAGGPPPGDGLSIELIRSNLRTWEGPWPPSQVQLTPYSDRRLRQVLKDAGTSYRVECAEADADRRKR